MPMAQDGPLEQIRHATDLPMDMQSEALQHLIRHSLVQVQGTLAQRRYVIHRLTEIFILNEAIAWRT